MEIFKNELYSRQLKTFGIESMKRLMRLKVLVIGIRGFGIEVSKNLVLSGVKKLGIYDKEIVKINDLGNNYFLKESHVNKCKRDEGCLKDLQELNPFVEVIVENNYIENYLNYDVICITEMIDSKIVKEMNQNCRKNKKGFIYSCNLGLIGVIFSDFGENFEILDETGEECTTMCIKYISREKNAFIETDSSYDKKGIRVGNYALFKDVQGMTEINGKIIQLKSHPEIDCYSIGDTSNYKEYIKGGIIEEIKVPIKKSYISFEQSYKEPKCNNFEIDIDKQNKNNKQMLHCVFMILQKYFNENLNLPKINDENISEYLANKAKQYYNEKKLMKNPFYSKISKEFNLEKMKNLINFSKVELPSICSFLGGLVAQEIIKFTGLYIPLDQWAWFDFYDSIKNLNKNIIRTPINSRYDEQIMVFGREIHEKLTKSNFFLIGAGAVGCEYLKILALMGASTDKNAKIIVTDNDNIETSNLNRQFLFRQKDVGKSKSKIACQSIKKINKNINCEALQLEVCSDNENIFNSNFWQKQDLILLAVDSLKARKYINTQCVLNEKKFLECGTLGGEASSQIVIPFLTQDYINFGNFEENSVNEKDENTLQKIAMCTLKQFPYKKEHCVELGRENIAEYFVENIKNLKLFLKDKEKYIKENTEKEKIFVIRNLLKIKIDNSFERCLEMGIFQFHYNYIEKIQNILEEKPANFKMKDGTFFWSGSKIRPHPLNFDLNNKFCLTFISTYGILLAQCLNIELIDYKNISLEILKLYDKGEFRKFFRNNEIDIQKEIIGIIKNNNLEKISDNIYPLVFEIDDDRNHQIDFIYASSNLKSKNFELGEIPWLKVKLIVGRIVPSIPTTSSSITGFISHQIYPLLEKNKNIKLETLNIINFNLRIPSFIIQKPFEIENYEDEEKDGLITKVFPKNSNLWSKLKIKNSMTISQFREYLLNKYGVELEGLYTLDEQPIINNNYSSKIEDAYFKIKKKQINESIKKIYFLIKGCGNDFDIAKMPYVEYEFH